MRRLVHTGVPVDHAHLLGRNLNIGHILHHGTGGQAQVELVEEDGPLHRVILAPFRPRQLVVNLHIIGYFY